MQQALAASFSRELREFSRKRRTIRRTWRTFWRYSTRLAAGHRGLGSAVRDYEGRYPGYGPGGWESGRLIVSSRRKRKRDRRKAEATANLLNPQGGWGESTKADLLLIRQAIREDWPVPDDVRRAIIDELFQEVDTDCSDVRRFIAIVRVILAMAKANINASS